MPPGRKPRNKNKNAAVEREIFGTSNDRSITGLYAPQKAPRSNALPYQNVTAGFKPSKNVGQAIGRAKNAGLNISPYTDISEFTVEEVDNATRALATLPPSIRELVRTGRLKITIGRESPLLTAGDDGNIPISQAAGVAGYRGDNEAFANTSTNYGRSNEGQPIGGRHKGKWMLPTTRMILNSPNGNNPVVLHELGHLMDFGSKPVTGHKTLDVALEIGRAITKGIAQTMSGRSGIPYASAAKDFATALKNQSSDRWMSEYIKTYGPVEAYAEAFAYYHASKRTRNMLPESIRLYFDKHYGSTWKPRSHGLTGRVYAD